MKFNTNKKAKGKVVITQYADNTYNVKLKGDKIEIVGIFLQEILSTCIDGGMPKKEVLKMVAEIYDGLEREMKK